MSDTVFACACGFKCVESQLNKSRGKCPKCGAHYLDTQDWKVKKSLN